MYALSGCCECVILILLCVCNIICLTQTHCKALCLYTLTLYNEKCQISLLQIVMLLKVYMYTSYFDHKSLHRYSYVILVFAVSLLLMDIFPLMYMSGWNTLLCLFIIFWERHLLLVHYRLFQWCVCIPVEEC